MAPICRLCLKTNLEDYKSIENNTFSIRTHIESMIPQIDIDIVDQPVICLDCSNIITQAYSFKQNCLGIEERIQAYKENVKGKINLEDFLEFEKCLGKQDILKIEEPTVKVEIFEDFENTAPPNNFYNDYTTDNIQETKEFEQTATEMAAGNVYNDFKDEDSLWKVKVEVLEDINNEKPPENIYKHNNTDGNTQKTKELQQNATKMAEKTIICKFCNKTVHCLPKRWEYHLKTHIKSKFVCVQCYIGFETKLEYCAHKKNVHCIENKKTERPHVCEYCGKSFAVPEGLMSHMKEHITVRKNYACIICGKAFDAASKLKLHMKVHNSIRDYVCQVCDKGFDNCRALTKHMRIHNNDKRFECEICGKRFTTNCNRKIHLIGCMRKHNVHNRPITARK